MLKGPGVRLRLPQVRAVAGEPPDGQLGAEHASDLDGLARSIDRVRARAGVVAREGAVGGQGVKPQPRRDELGHHSGIVKGGADMRRFGEHLLVGLVLKPGDDVVVMKHDGFEPGGTEALELPAEVLRRAGLRAVRVTPLADVPGADREAIDRHQKSFPQQSQSVGMTEQVNRTKKFARIEERYVPWIVDCLTDGGAAKALAARPTP